MKKRDLLRRIEELETRLALVENRSPVVWPCVEPMPVYPFWEITVGGGATGTGGSHQLPKTYVTYGVNQEPIA